MDQALDHGNVLLARLVLAAPGRRISGVFQIQRTRTVQNAVFMIRLEQLVYRSGIPK